MAQDYEILEEHSEGIKNPFFIKKELPPQTLDTKKYLGDWLADFFSFFGIKPWKGCSCKTRQGKLNKFHKNLENKIKGYYARFNNRR